MIHDKKILSAISQQWKAVRKLCHSSHRQYIVGGAVINETPPSESYNLPFVLAYAVLDQVLAELINEGTFQCAGRAQLGGRMEASKNVLPWQNYKHITNGRNDRNDLAHEAKLLDKNKCFEYIDAIETELKAWGVL
jgi:hypothetical protein